MAKRKFNQNWDLKDNTDKALVTILKSGKKFKLPQSCIIPLPQKGNVLPLASILAALGTARTVVSNVSKITNMVGVLKSTKDKLFGKGLASVRGGRIVKAWPCTLIPRDHLLLESTLNLFPNFKSH